MEDHREIEAELHTRIKEYDRKNDLVKQIRKFLDDHIIGKTEYYPGDWAFGGLDDVTMARLLEDALELLEERG